jgi:DNA-binding MarR family transcriptional regulator
MATMTVVATTTSNGPLVEVLATRLRRMDLVGWRRVASSAEHFELSFENLRVLLALTTEAGLTAVSELADMGGLSLHAAYPAIDDLRCRGYVREERRRYALTEQGQDLIATLDAAHLEGIQAYVDDLDPKERRRLEEAFGSPHESRDTHPVPRRPPEGLARGLEEE